MSATPSVTNVLEACSLIVVCVAALVGNVGLIAIVLKDRRLQTVTNFFILNLSLADILVSAVSMPITIVTVLQTHWPLGDVGCTVVGFVTILTFIASVMGLALIAVNRYCYVVHWKRYATIFTKRRVIPYALLVWGISLTLALPPLLGWAEYRYIPGKSYCFVFWPSDVYYMYFMIIVCFFGPLSVMVFSYLSIFRLTRNIQQRVENNRSNTGDSVATRGQRTSSRSSAEEKRFTNTLVMVVGCFIICWAPFALTMFFDVHASFSLPREVDFLSLLLGYMNSMCNPLFYGLRNRRMRKGFLYLYSQCVPCLRSCKEGMRTAPSKVWVSSRRRTSSATNHAPRNKQKQDSTTPTLNRNSDTPVALK